MHPVVDMRHISKDYRSGQVVTPVLKDVDLNITSGSFTAIMGPSGSGKTTMLNIMGCLDTPTSGSLLLSGREVTGLADAELSRMRNRYIGFVFQSCHLLPQFDVRKNISLPLLYAQIDRTTMDGRITDMCRRLGIAKRMDHKPSQLSAGEKQRAALARALVNRPSLLLADEPTGNLDSRTEGEVMDLLAEINSETGVTIVVITHSREVARRTHNIIHLRDGRIGE